MFQTNRISLLGNRIGGERFPQIRGAFLLIDKCDIPCEISLDGSFYFMAREGLDIRGPFNELYIRHPEYLLGSEYGSRSDAGPSINIITSSDSAINNYYSDSYFPAGIPFQFTAGGKITAPIFGNIRYVKFNFQFYVGLNSQPVDFRVATITNPTLTVKFHSSPEQMNFGIGNCGYDIADPNFTGDFTTFSHNGHKGNIFIVMGKYSEVSSGPLVFVMFESFDIPVQSNSRFVTAQLNMPEFDFGTIERFNDGRSIGTVLAK
jgi:hypothetical protein